MAPGNLDNADLAWNHVGARSPTSGRPVYGYRKEAERRMPDANLPLKLR
jgi:hypothetical protein